MKKYKHEKDKDPLEQLFHGRDDDFDIEFREDDWRALQPALDLLDAKAAHRFRIRLISAAAVFLILMFSYFTFHNYSRINELSDQIAQSSQTNGSDGESVQQDDSRVPETLGSENREQPGNSLTESDLNTIADLLENPDEDSETQRITANDYGDVENLSIASANPQMMTSNVFYDRIPVTAELNRTGNPEMIDLNSNYFNTIITEAPGMLTPSYAYPVEDNPGFSRSAESSRVTVGLALSPDATGAGSISGFSDPGYKAGAVIEYAFSEKLSVSVGIIQTEVRYRAASAQYDPPYYWPPGTSPDEILATCLMFDIPISLKYNLFTFSRSRLYSSLSLSSYIMQNEEYRFRYGNGNTGGPEAWRDNTGKGYWFSNAGFSIGYEFDLNRTWSLRAEPFIRLPISEVGWGNAKLYSVGSFISLNYRL